MADLLIHPCRFEPPFAKAPLHSGRLDLLFKEVNLGAQHLALFVHGPILVDFGHKTPIVAGELVKGMADRGKSGPTSHQGGQEPPWQGPHGVVIIIIVVFFGGEEVGDEGEVPWCIVLSVSSHFPPIHLLDPLGSVSLPILAGQVKVDFSSVFFVPWWGFFKGTLGVNSS